MCGDDSEEDDDPDHAAHTAESHNVTTECTDTTKIHGADRITVRRQQYASAMFRSWPGLMPILLLYRPNKTAKQFGYKAGMECELVDSIGSAAAGRYEAGFCEMTSVILVLL